MSFRVFETQKGQIKIIREVTTSDALVFEPFGGATLENNVFEFPSGAYLEPFAGFVNITTVQYPLTFIYGGEITLDYINNHSSSVYLEFLFERLPYDPSDFSATIPSNTITSACPVGTGSLTIPVAFPISNTYSSFVIRLRNDSNGSVQLLDVPITLTNIQVKTNPEPPEPPILP